MNNNFITEELLKYAKMKESGVLTENEFRQLKNKLLSEIDINFTQ